MDPFDSLLRWVCFIQIEILISIESQVKILISSKISSKTNIKFFFLLQKLQTFDVEINDQSSLTDGIKLAKVLHKM